MFKNRKDGKEIVYKGDKKYIKKKRIRKFALIKRNFNVFLAIGIVLATTLISIGIFKFLESGNAGMKTSSVISNDSAYYVPSSEADVSYSPQSSVPTGQRVCIVSFIDDDGNDLAYTKLMPIFKAKNVPYTIGIITGLSIGKMTDEHLKEADKLGFEFASNTVNYLDLTTLAEAQVEEQMKNSKEWIQNKGYKCSTLIYPLGLSNSLSKVLAKKYYKCAFKYGPGDNAYPLDTYALKRTAMGSKFDPPNHTFNDTSLLEYYQSRVDSAIASRNWLVFTLHANDSAFNSKQMEYLEALIDYIKSKNVDIMTAGNAFDSFNAKGKS